MLVEKYEIEYNDGKKETIDSGYVCRYYKSTGSNFQMLGTGCTLDNILNFLCNHTPILISGEVGKTDLKSIVRIINTHQIRAINPRVYLKEEQPTK